MKKYCLFFLLVFAFGSPAAFAQAARVPRTTPAQQQLDQQKGELEHFKNMLFRFETAVEERDQENTDILKQVLLDLVAKDVTSSKEAGDPFSKKLPGLLKALREYKFPVAEAGSEEFKGKLALFTQITDWKAEKVASLETAKE